MIIQPQISLIVSKVGTPSLSTRPIGSHSHQRKIFFSNLNNYLAFTEFLSDLCYILRLIAGSYTLKNDFLADSITNKTLLEF